MRLQIPIFDVFVAFFDNEPRLVWASTGCRLPRRSDLDVPARDSPAVAAEQSGLVCSHEVFPLDTTVIVR